MRQIVKQPDGMLAVWSTVVDDFVLVNATIAEVADFMLDWGYTSQLERVTLIVASLNRGRKPYGQDTHTWAHLQETRKQQHGEAFALPQRDIREVEPYVDAHMVLFEHGNTSDEPGKCKKCHQEYPCEAHNMALYILALRERIAEHEG